MTAARRTVLLEMDGLKAIVSALDGDLGHGFAKAVALIQEGSGRLVVTGMGKSGHIARKVASTMASTGTPALFVHPAEASHGDLGMIQDGDVVLAFSWSGETSELSDIVAYTRRFRIPLIAVTSRADSALAAAADLILSLPAMPEACPNNQAPTTSTTMQLALGDALAIYLLERRGFSVQDFHQFHPGGKLGARLRSVRDLMHADAAVPIVNEGATLAEAIVEMTSKRFGLTAVVGAAGDLCGILTDGDLRRAFQRGFENCSVADVMTRTPRVVAPDDLAAEALADMSQAQITALIVVDKGKPVGVLHVHDLLRAGVL